MKAVAISGTRGSVPGIPFCDTTEAMRRVGNNAGNLVFQYAVSNLIDEPTKLVGTDVSWSAKDIRDACRIMVIPSANFLREGFDFTQYVRFLDDVQLPLVFIGLGAQADDFNKAQFDFHPSILRLIDLIKERSPKISIRGEFTARVLDRFGVTGHVITGCPSNFLNPSENLPDMIAEKAERKPEFFITHGDEPWPKKKMKGDVERRLTDWTINGDGIMVQQAVPQMQEFIRENNPYSGGMDDVKRFGNSLRKALAPNATPEEFRRFVALKLRTYYSVDQWIEDSARFDFSIGLRLHGNMTAWQSGTPAMWITHDSRTKELSDTMGLPNIDIQDFLENCPTLQDAWDRFEFDKEAYRGRRAELRSRLQSILESFDINMKKP